MIFLNASKNFTFRLEVDQIFYLVRLLGEDHYQLAYSPSIQPFALVVKGNYQKSYIFYCSQFFSFQNHENLYTFFHKNIHSNVNRHF